jgi:N-sulfoglucosamine sulfohydrolase
MPDFLPGTKEVREQLAGYYAQITRAGHGPWEETLILFLSDHGTSEPGAMGSQYEHGVHAPLILRAPVGKAGVVSEAPAAFTDLTPTMPDWAGVVDPDKDTHGRSLLPILGETDPPGWDEVVLSHVAHEICSYYPMRTLRERRYKPIWKLTRGPESPVPVDTFQWRLRADIRERGETRIGRRKVEQFLHRPKLELHDLESDPRELENLAGKPEHADRVKTMSARLVKRLEETEDPWLMKYRPEW